MEKALVLCVDDDTVNLNVRELLLRHEGYDTVTACDGETAMRVFATANVDLVIVDFLMPGLNGAEVARLMRSMKPNIPIMMLSSLSTRPAEANGQIDAYLTKGKTHRAVDRANRILVVTGKKSR